MTNNEELEGYALLIQVIGQGRRPKEERMGRGACATRPRTRGMITAEAETGVARLQDQDWTWKKRCQVNPNFRLLWPKIEFLAITGS